MQRPRRIDEAYGTRASRKQNSRHRQRRDNTMYESVMPFAVTVAVENTTTVILTVNKHIYQITQHFIETQGFTNNGNRNITSATQKIALSVKRRVT
ncbi:hypothetical protein EVAR_65226_1 [Eumeta japonica]|uniref:Uncharacterized protein n=1 Tax=Eumeta variegata TaxID=151549 RepID=A0A4C1ZA22_EUMVA|nr:hypothetical protein EVAR_65226_1 [Eumeta japonica]